MWNNEAPAGRVHPGIDEAAKERLSRIVSLEAGRIGRACGLPPDRCDDVAQEVWIYLVENPEPMGWYAEDSSPHAERSLRRVVANRAYQAMDCDAKHRTIPSAIATSSCRRYRAPGEPELDEATLRRAELRHAVDLLPEAVTAQQREFMLDLLVSCSARRHAEKAGIAFDSVLRQLRRVAAAARKPAKRTGRGPQPWWLVAWVLADAGATPSEIARRLRRTPWSIRYALKRRDRAPRRRLRKPSARAGLQKPSSGDQTCPGSIAI